MSADLPLAMSGPGVVTTSTVLTALFDAKQRADQFSVGRQGRQEVGTQRPGNPTAEHGWVLLDRPMDPAQLAAQLMRTETRPMCRHW